MRPYPAVFLRLKHLFQLSAVSQQGGKPSAAFALGYEQPRVDVLAEIGQDAGFDLVCFCEYPTCAGVLAYSLRADKRH
jgi:hypothetical protein